MLAKFVPEDLEHMSICPSLASFKFASDDSNVIDLAALLKASINSEFEPEPAEPGATQDFFGDDDFGGGGGGDGMADGGMDFFNDEPADYDGDDAETPDGEGGTKMEDGWGRGPIAPFDPRKVPDERELVMAMASGGDQIFDYFDSALMKNWAGPEHWKMRRMNKKGGQFYFCFALRHDCLLTSSIILKLKNRPAKSRLSSERRRRLP
jgi:condensin complex subunit 2